jgi:hypothetical protein
VIPAGALLRQTARSDAWYRPEGSKPKTVQGFTHISGVFLSAFEGWMPSELSLGYIDPVNIDERREALSVRSKQAAKTRVRVKQECTTCAARSKCSQGALVHACGGARTPEMLTAALARYLEQYGVLNRIEGQFTEEQAMFLMRMGGSAVAGRTEHIKTRSKEVVLGGFTRKNRYSGQDYVFRVRAGTRGYSRYTAFSTWDDLVATLPAVQDMFEAQKEYLRPISARVHLLYTLVVDRLQFRRSGFGNVQPLYTVYATAHGATYKYAADRWREHYSHELHTEDSDASLVSLAYFAVSNTDVVKP